MKSIFLVFLFGILPSSAAAQSVVRILSFEKNDGIIDRGADGGIRVGDVFEVNRYDGDFVYWVGRVEVVVVKARFAGVKLLAKSESATIQKGDVLELQKREIDPMLDKLKQSTPVTAGNGVAKAAPPKAGKAGSPEDFLLSPKRRQRILFGATGGLILPVINSSRLAGSNFLVVVQNVNNQQQTIIYLSEAYAASLGFQAFFALPLAERLFLNLNYAYAPLNVNRSKEAELLSTGLKASASLAMVTAALHWRWSPNLQIGMGAGMYLPQMTVQSSRQTMTISNRQLGLALGATHQLALGANLWLRSQLAYNVFLDQGPAIHFLAFQVGPCFGIGK